MSLLGVRIVGSEENARRVAGLHLEPVELMQNTKSVYKTIKV
jgi:hypothetical protein